MGLSWLNYSHDSFYEFSIREEFCGREEGKGREGYDVDELELHLSQCC